MNKKIFTWFMTLCMVFALFPTFALAAENDNGIHYGYYKDGQWQESTVQDSDFGIDGLQSISKTAAPVAGQDNTYDITLKVVMSQTTTTAPGAAATVLVVDTSGSTDWCSECGFEPEFNLIPLGTQYHKKTCSRYNNSSFETRLDAEKTAALEFVDTFSGCVKNGVYTENTALTRYVAIVEFNSYGSVTQEWVNVATKDGYDKARSAVNKLSANGGTNLDDGLADANTLLGRDTVKNISAKNVIALTDGVPTYAMKNGNRIGDGTGGSSAINDQTKATATTLKTKANLYTVCFGAAGEVTYPGGPTVGKFLEESIATPASADGKTKYAFNAANADELYNAFAAITDTIVNGINAGTVNDSIPAGVEQTAGTITPNETTGSFTWELNPDAALVETSGDITTYTYSYTYRVKIDPTTDNAKAGNWIPTNGRTTLTVGDKTVDFGIPAVKAKYYEIHYYVYDNETEGYVENTDLTKTLLSSGDDISSYNVPLTKTGHTFSGWFTTEELNEDSAWTPDKMPAENINVYGAFMVNDYKVNYIVNNDSSFNKTAVVKYGDAIPGYAPEKTGYTFNGWYKEAALTNKWTAPATMPAEDITVYGAFTANDYTITYMVKGDDGVYAKNNEATLKFGAKVDDYTPTEKEGHTFSGWYNEEALTNAWSKPETMPASNITVYGAYTANDYTITYMVKGDDGNYAEDNKVTLKFGAEITGYSPAEKEGHSFTGWFEDEALTNAWNKPETMPAKNIVVYGGYITNGYTITYMVKGDDGNYAENNKIALKYGDAIPEYAPEKTGHTFSGWYHEDALTNAWAKPETMPANNITVYGAFNANDYTITYYLKNSDGGFDKDHAVTLTYGAAIQDYTPAAIKGYDFHGWYTEDALTNLWTNPGTMPDHNIDLYGEQVCVLNFDDHFAYIIGYEDGTVRPQANITRAEVATIFFRLLTDDSRAINKTSENPFSDVHAGQWYNNAISTLANMKILNGYNDGTFRPNQPITRAEMATIISAFANLTENTKTFTDIEGHWAQKYIELAAGNGWITGYEDGTFRPNNEITRAETMTMINRVMKRVPKDETCLLDGMTTYPDCVSGQWYYIAVQEATNSHYFQREVGATDGSEKWLELRENFDWSQLEK